MYDREKAAVQRQEEKLKTLCAENGCGYRFINIKYPAEVIISTAEDGQTTMEGNTPSDRPGELRFVFADADMYIIPGARGGIVLTKTVQNKMRNAAEALFDAYCRLLYAESCTRG